MAVAEKRRSQAAWTPARIRAMRLRLGLSIEQAADRLGVMPRTVLAWELPSQHRSPSASHQILLNLLSEGKI